MEAVTVRLHQKLDEGYRRVKICANGFAAWEANKQYEADDFVFHGDIIYRCIMAHVAGESFDIAEKANWTDMANAVGISDINYSRLNSQLSIALTDGTTKVFNNVGANFYGGFDETLLFEGFVQAGFGSNKTIVTMTDQMSNYDYLLLICLAGTVHIPIFMPTDYFVAHPTVASNYGYYGNPDVHARFEIYWESDTSIGQMYGSIKGEGWTKIGITRVIGLKGRHEREEKLSGIQQLTKLGVIAPETCEIEIARTETFNRSPLEVLKFTPGAQGQVETLCRFDNSDADDFTVDGESGETARFVEFDGTMHPRTVYEVAVSVPVAMGECYYSESEEIDFADYKTVEAVE